MANDPPSADVGPVGPAWHIPMTQERTLQDLPSQLELDWQDSVPSTPTASPAAIRVSSTPTASPAAIAEELGAVGPSQVVEPHVVVAVDTFAEVSQIAAEVVMDATQ